MQTQIIRRCVIEEKIEELDEKPLCHPPSCNRSTRQSIGIHGLARDPLSLLPAVLKPSNLLLQQGFSEPCLV